jgi:DNA polymerase-3 subunit beta
MKFVCTQENLTHGLHVVARTASKNIALPILNNILVIAENGVVKLQTTNLEVAVTTQIRAKVESEGRYTANSRLLADYISALKNAKLTIETTNDGLSINSENAETVIKGLPADEFPVLPKVNPVSQTSIPTSVFRTALEEVIFAAANDEARPEISGVYLNIQGENMVLAATDSYRLSERRVTTINAPTQDAQVILPARAAQEMLRILDVANDTINLELDDKQALLKCGDTEIVTRLIEGKYPEYQQIIPAKHETTAVVAKQELVDVIRAASLFSQPGINDLGVHIDKAGSIKFSSASAQAGHHTASVAATVNGPEKDIVFNNRYLLDGVQSLPGDSVSIELGDPQAPGVLRSTNSPDGLYLIMPIRQ